MSPITSAATSSYEYDLQSENLVSRCRKSPVTSSGPFADFHAPKTVTGSFWDQIAKRGAASPLWSASSASRRRVFTHSRNSSLSLIWPPISERAQFGDDLFPDDSNLFAQIGQAVHLDPGPGAQREWIRER